MGAVDTKLIKDKPDPCPRCGEDVWDVYANVCKVCATIAYLEFRFAFNWPLTDADKKRLGLA
jgi:ribosomal protein L37E